MAALTPDDRLAVELLPLDEAKADPSNPKNHDIGAVVESIRRYGFVDPVIVDRRTGWLLSGHGRTEALRALRQENPNEPPDGIVLSPPPQCRWLLPTVHVTSRDEQHARGLLVALNRTVELGGWDDAALAALLIDLAKQDALAGSGYDGDDLDRLLADLNDDPPDFAPDDRDTGNPGGAVPASVACPNCGHTFTPDPA